MTAEKPAGCNSPYCEPPWCKNCGEHPTKETSLKTAAVVGCISALTAGVFADIGMSFTAVACAFITGCCFVVCGAEWETKR